MQTPGFDRRSFLRTAAAVGLPAPAAPSAAGALPPEAGRILDRVRGEVGPQAASAEEGGAAGTAFRWLGTAGWRIDHGDRTVLFDPYLTRFGTGLFQDGGRFDPATPLVTDPLLVDPHIGAPELVLVSHSHWDHINDVPHIATGTGATVVGTETSYHLLRALGVPASQLVVVKGGEVFDFGGGLTVEVVSSRHSRNEQRRYLAPGTVNALPPRAPATVGDLPEGDTLAFQVGFEGGPTAFLMGASDFAEREVAGLRPDLAMVAVPTSTATHRYVPRLMRALGCPRTVVPVHWDVFESPLVNPVRPDPHADLAAFTEQVRQASPGTRVVVPDYLTPRTF
ncbi:MBL fold metallo-hydrolase [Kitasatospora sp. NPDC057015]|uniref:MBL fold metallo-hydrolase n=1 Tax=Kitasatospora sp. NPDC057015 TaxID=3346001 RepID=UPI00363395C9